MKAFFIACICSIVCISTVFAQNLNISTSDLRIEQSLEGGYYLYIRQKAGVNSILITESTEDPARQAASYAFRNPIYHPENGDEIRVLNGEVIRSEDLFFLLDSSPVPDRNFGMAFRIFIPYIILYGYSWSRQGELQVLDGTYLNVRSFERPYADYSGAWQDNPFIIRVTQMPFEGPPAGNYSDDTVSAFSNIANRTEGRILYSDGNADILNNIANILSAERGDTLDLVLVIDSTQSMKNDIAFLRSRLANILSDNIIGFDIVRIGFVWYRDYNEDFLYRFSPFEQGIGHVRRILESVAPAGGRDIPEAVNEALYAALSEFDWRGDNRKIILIGDAPPHPRPRGEVTPELVESSAEEMDVSVHVIILPH